MPNIEECRADDAIEEINSDSVSESDESFLCEKKVECSQATIEISINFRGNVEKLFFNQHTQRSSHCSVLNCLCIKGGVLTSLPTEIQYLTALRQLSEHFSIAMEKWKS